MDKIEYEERIKRVNELTDEKLRKQEINNLMQKFIIQVEQMALISMEFLLAVKKDDEK